MSEHLRKSHFFRWDTKFFIYIFLMTLSEAPMTKYLLRSINDHFIDQIYWFLILSQFKLDTTFIPDSNAINDTLFCWRLKYWSFYGLNTHRTSWLINFIFNETVKERKLYRNKSWRSGKRKKIRETQWRERVHCTSLEEKLLGPLSV